MSPNPIDPDFETMRRYGYKAVDRIVDYLAQLDHRRVWNLPRADQLRTVVDEPLPHHGHGIAASIDHYFDHILPHANAVNHPRFFGYIPSPGSFAAAIGAWVAAATNLFMGTWLGGAVMAQVEVLTLDWVRQMLGLPASFSAGIFTSGGSMANLGALAAARQRALLAGHSPAALRVYVSEEAHFSMAKAARVLGFADSATVAIAVDAEQRLRVDQLRAAMERDRDAALVPACVCATAGTTSTGAMDPIAECAALCREYRAWLHVDGAYGAALAILPAQTELRALLGQADSITIDPHKWLYCPFDCGCLLTPHESELRGAFTADGAVMQDVPRDEVNFFERGPELSRNNRALKLWMLIRSVGVDAIQTAMVRDIDLCRLGCELLRQDPRITIVTPPRMSVFSFSVAGGEAAGQALLRRIIADGFLSLSSSRVNGAFVLRFCVVNHRTTETHVRESVARIRELLDDY